MKKAISIFSLVAIMMLLMSNSGCEQNTTDGQLIDVIDDKNRN